MRISGIMRSRGFSMSVEATFRNPQFFASSSQLRRIEGRTTSLVTPFSLVTSRLQLAIEEASIVCNVSVAEIQDMYPCTSFQASIMANTARKPGSYINTFTYCLLEVVDQVRYAKAWETVYEMLPILRTRIVLSETMHYQQVIVNEKMTWSDDGELHATGLPSDQYGTQMQLGEPLIRFALRRPPEKTATELVVTVHHALYDGWSLSRIFALVKTVYTQDDIPAEMTGFVSFVKFTEDIDTASARSFWQMTLKDAPEPSFPTMSKHEQALDDGLCTLAISVPCAKSSMFSLATVSRVAWGLVLSKYENTTDVVFGNTVSGRSANLEGIESIVGPTLSTVPVRVKYDPHQPIIALLRNAQAMGNDMIPHKQFGLSSIAQLGPDERRARNFRTMLIVQTPDFELQGDEASALEKLCSASPTVYGFPLTISLYVGRNDATITAKYDSKLLDDIQVNRILRHFEHTFTLLRNHTSDQTLADLDLFCQQDLDEIMSWNLELPAKVEACIHNLISRTVREYARKSAIECSEGGMTYETLELRSDQLACHLSRLGVTTGSYVPLCFDKSRWAVVAMLAVLKAGGAFVPLVPAHPDARIQSVLEDIEARIVIASPSHCNRGAFGAASTVVTLDEDFFSQVSNKSEKAVSPATPQSAAYALFTSGTTGRPKGFVIEHAAYCSGALTRGRLLSRNENSRVLQFASYGFDPSIEDILTSLIFGSCICIPTSLDMENNLGDFMTRSKVNFANLTPSFAATLQPSDCPTLKTLLLSGEVMTEDLVNTWGNHVRLINGYGPSECCIKCALRDDVRPGDSPANIGFAVCSNLWVADPNNIARLAPIGAIGELVVEGPCLSRGYIRTAPANGFIPAPSWLKSIRNADCVRVFQTGDLVRYQSDGSLLFIGRKDKQVKINGQRTELGDIEQHLRSVVPSSTVTAVELVTPMDEANPILVAFSSAATRAR
jgi:amino acid adenylation domain-containing protein